MNYYSCSIGNLFALELAGFFIFLFIAVWLEMLISGGIAVFKWPTKMYDAANMEDENAASNEDVEPHSLTEASSLRSGKGVVVRNLVKKFGNFTAVNKFSIDFLHDQVTVLLVSCRVEPVMHASLMHTCNYFRLRHFCSVPISGPQWSWKDHCSELLDRFYK